MPDTGLVGGLRTEGASVPLPEVIIRVRAAGKTDRALVNEQGPAILDSLRQHFLGAHERRAKERVLWARPVHATFLVADAPAGDPIRSRPAVARDSLHAYDPLSDFWSFPTRMPTARAGVSVAKIGDEIFIFGGRRGFGNETRTNVVEIFDLGL